MALMKPTGVATQHPDYSRMLPMWQKCIDCAEGEHAVHDAKTHYLPRLSEESTEDYNQRMARTPFFNAVWRTISGLKGTMFRKPPQLTAPEPVAVALYDADMAGAPLDAVAQELVEELLTTGRCGLMVDYPQVDQPGNMTAAQVAALGLRPYLALYPATTIINWKSGRINGVMQLTMVVLQEQNVEPGESEFDSVSATQYRVLDLFEGAYRQRMFRQSDSGDVLVWEVFPLMNGQRMREIPFVIFGVDSLGWRIESPPLLDLAEMNLHHYTVSADYEHGCHFSGLPTAILSGYQPAEDAEPLRIGGKAIIALPDPNARGTYMEVQSNFEALRRNLDEKKAEMAVLGARMLENQKTSVEAAETLRQRQAGEQSALSGLADIVSMGITRALQWFGAWMRATGEITYQINKDFIPAGMTAQELTALVQAWQSGAISDQTLYSNLQQGEIIDADTSFEEEQERIRSSAPLLMGGGSDSTDDNGDDT
jgi:hypothetical protein